MIESIDIDDEWRVVIVRLDVGRSREQAIAYVAHRCGGWTPPVRGESQRCKNCHVLVPESLQKKIRAYNFIGGLSNG